MAKHVKGADEPTIKEQVVVHMRRREGAHLTTDEIASALGIKRMQATSALHNLAKRAMPDNVRRVGDGVWVYQTSARTIGSPTGDALQVVGRMFDGRLLLKDEEGAMWEAQQIADPRS